MAKRWTDENGIPTVEGATAMFDAMKLAREAREERECRAPINMSEARARRDASRPYGLSVAFDRDTEDFVLGVETGLLMARLDARPETWGGTYHASNRTMIERVAAAAGYLVTVQPSGSAEWIFVDFALSEGH